MLWRPNIYLANNFSPKDIYDIARCMYKTDARELKLKERSLLTKKGQSRISNSKGVTIYRLQERDYNEKGKFSYLARLLKILIRSFYFLSIEHLKNQYKLVHVHSIPDFEIFSAFLPKLSGAKLNIDIHGSTVKHKTLYLYGS